jgi:DNA-binding NarL/FixJ family response regulator
VALIDDHPVIAAGLAGSVPRLEVVASFSSVEEFLRQPQVALDVVLLDLQLAADPGRTGVRPQMGTRAIRSILAAGRGPVVIYTAIAEEMLLAACLAAGAKGAITKAAPPATIAEVVEMAAGGNLWVDPKIAGALVRYASRRHAGALSAQQANALRYRGQGLKQRVIAERIGVGDPEVVHKYLQSAVDKLFMAGRDEQLSDSYHPGAGIDEVARRSGLATGMVCWDDLQER